MRSRSAAHAEAVPVPPQLYSGRMARQRQDNRMLHKAPQFLLASLAPLYSNTPGEVGQVVHTRLPRPDTQSSVPPGQHTGPIRLWSGLTIVVPVTRIPPRKMERNGSLIVHISQCNKYSSTQKTNTKSCRNPPLEMSRQNSTVYASLSSMQQNRSCGLYRACALSPAPYFYIILFYMILNMYIWGLLPFCLGVT